MYPCPPLDHNWNPRRITDLQTRTVLPLAFRLDHKEIRKFHRLHQHSAEHSLADFRRTLGLPDAHFLRRPPLHHHHWQIGRAHV